MSRGSGGLRVYRQLVEPARAWIAWAPRVWPAADAPWTDLAHGTVVEPRGPAAPLALDALEAELAAGAIDDLLYLPPVAAAQAPARDRLLAALAAAGVPALVQLRPGDPPREAAAAGDVDAGVTVVYDLLGPLLAGDLAALAELDTGGGVPATAEIDAVWPLIAGVSAGLGSDERHGGDLWRDGCGLLAAAGVGRVLPLAVELTAVQRRRLAEGRGDAVFDALFHGPAPSERAFARVAAAHGMGSFLARPAGPAGRGSERLRRNRALAAALALAGELWLRLGRSEAAGPALLRAARGVEDTHLDLAALARDGNLEVLDWLDGRGRAIIEETLADGVSATVAALEAAYAGTDSGADSR